MLHHVSFSVHDTAGVAQGIANLLKAEALRAPAPPFPDGSWFVVLGDEAGSLIELTPWGTVFDPREGVAFEPAMSPRSASHVLVSTSRVKDEVLTLANELGWRASVVDTGLFKFVKIWIDETLLLEVLPAEFQRGYRDAFNGKNLPTLGQRLHRLEATVKDILALRGSHHG